MWLIWLPIPVWITLHFTRVRLKSDFRDHPFSFNFRYIYYPPESTFLSKFMSFKFLANDCFGWNFNHQHGSNTQDVGVALALHLASHSEVFVFAILIIILYINTWTRKTCLINPTRGTLRSPADSKKLTLTKESFCWSFKHEYGSNTRGVGAASYSEVVFSPIQFKNLYILTWTRKTCPKNFYTWDSSVSKWL